ncbi:hypothetical protein ACS0TY_029598 [Phlomoides rotata]
MAKSYKSLEAQFTQMSQQQRTTDFQLGQFSQTVGNMQNKGKFPSTTEPNPKEYCKAIKLRSGTSYQEPSIPKEHDGEEKKNMVEQEEKEDLSKHDEEEEIAPMKEDEEEKGLMKNAKEEKRIPKWKLAKGLKEKESDEVECDEWWIPKIPDRVPFPQRFTSPIEEECRSIQLLNRCEKGGKMTKQEISLKMPLKDLGDSKEENGRKKGTLKQTLKLEQNASLRGLDMEKKMMDLLCSREDEERKKKSSKELKSEKGFEVGDEVVWNNSKVKGILGILKLKRIGILIVKKVHHGGSLEVENSDGDLFITNGTKVKLFHPTVPKEVPNIKLEREA